MPRPIKAIKTEITVTRDRARDFVAAYRYERMIAKSQAKLAETKLVPGVVQIYA